MRTIIIVPADHGSECGDMPRPVDHEVVPGRAGGAPLGGRAGRATRRAGPTAQRRRGPRHW